MTRLSVNLNKFALIRNARGTDFPNLPGMAERAVASGAHGVTVHPRPDQRHVRDDDVPALRDLCARHARVEFNVEGNPEPRFMELVLANPPDQCTLVPDDPGQLTSDHGWDLSGDNARLVARIERLRQAGIRVSLFMDPDCKQIERAPDVGADRVELYTESYAAAFDAGRHAAELERFRRAALCAAEAGLGVNAGHDLNQRNLGAFLKAVPHVLEVSIGHAIVVESFDHGFEATLSTYLDVIERTRAGRP